MKISASDTASKEKQTEVVQHFFKSKSFSSSDVSSHFRTLGVKQKNDFYNRNRECEEPMTKSGKWTKEEDEILINSINLYGDKNWKAVSRSVPGRNPVQCLHRWSKILQPGLIKGPWSIEEDRKLLSWVKREGPNKWANCAEFIRGRSGKQCRERWHNTLNPGVKKGNWEIEEDYMIFKLFQKYGTQWSKINQNFTRRTENSIKNRFYSTLRRIAAESKRNFSETKKNVKKSKEYLLAYVQDAIKEKTIKLIRKYSVNESTNANSEGNSGRFSENEDNDELVQTPLVELEKRVEQLLFREVHAEKKEDAFEEPKKDAFDSQINMLIDNMIEVRDGREYLSEPLNDSRLIFFDEDLTERSLKPTLEKELNTPQSLLDQLNDIEEILKSTKNSLLQKTPDIASKISTIFNRIL